MSDRYRWFAPFFIATLALATVFPGLFLSFEDSEIWGITSSRRLVENPFVLTSAHFKPLFSLIYGSVVALAPNDWMSLMASRWVTMAFAAAGLYSLITMGLMVARDSSSLEERAKTPITLVYFALVGTLPLLVVHFPKSRSDTIAASFVLISCLLLSLLKNRHRFRRYLYLFSAIAALLITPKSIDLAVILGIFFLGSEKEDPSSKDSRLVVTLWLLGPLILISAFLILTSREIILKTLIYWIDTYRDFDPTSYSAWSAAVRTIITGPIVTLVIGAGAAIGLMSFGKLSSRERTFLLTGGVALAFILIHSQKYFFFLASRVPFLALGALPGVLRLSVWLGQRLAKKDFYAGAKILAVGFFVSLLLTFSTLQNYSGFYLRHQKAVYHALVGYMQRADATHYWDAIGLFPKQNTLFHYPSPGDETNKRIIEYVEFSRPSLVLRSSKMELLEPDVIAWLSTKYIPLGDQLFARYLPLEKIRECRLDENELRKILADQKIKFPLAMFTRSRPGGRWIRVPLRWSNGATKDSLDSFRFDGASVTLADCDQEGVQYAVTESKPWDALPAPVFSQFFGYDGTL